MGVEAVTVPKAGSSGGWLYVARLPGYVQGFQLCRYPSHNSARKTLGQAFQSLGRSPPVPRPCQLPGQLLPHRFSACAEGTETGHNKWGEPEAGLPAAVRVFGLVPLGSHGYHHRGRVQGGIVRGESTWVCDPDIQSPTGTGFPARAGQISIPFLVP